MKNNAMQYVKYCNTMVCSVLQCNVLHFMLTSTHRQKYHLVTFEKSNNESNGHCNTLIKTILHVMPTLWQCSWCYNKKNMFSLHKWCKCECKYCKTYLSQDTQWTLHCKQCMWMFIVCLDVSRSLSSLYFFGSPHLATFIYIGSCKMLSLIILSFSYCDQTVTNHFLRNNVFI